MTMKQSNLVIFEEVSQVLHRLCSNENSGVFYISTDLGEGAGIVLDRGRIVDAGFKTARGVHALTKIGAINKAKYFFREGEKALPGCRIPDEAFPSTGRILEYLRDQQHAGARRQPAANCRGKVLVIDDSRVVRRVVHTVLSQNEFHVIEAIDGEQGIEKVIQERPNMVFLDLILPGIDGYRTLARIRQTGNGRHLPVVTLSANDALKGDITNGSSTANGHINKPFKPEELLEAAIRHTSGQ